MPDGRWTGTSSKYLGDYYPARMFDGYINSFFHTDLGTKAYQWVQVNFGSVIEV